MDQAALGTPSRVSEVQRGKKWLRMMMVQRLRAASACRRTCCWRRPCERRLGVRPDEQRPKRVVWRSASEKSRAGWNSFAHYPHGPS
jgi:hypothetical protein